MRPAHAVLSKLHLCWTAAVLIVATGAPVSAGPTRLATGADGSWREVAPPIGRDACVYDPLRQRLIVLGGAGNDNLAGVWTLPLSGTAPYAWSFEATSGTRPTLGDLTAIYDSPRDRIVAFATDSHLGQNVVWTLSLSTMTWTPLSPAGPPPALRRGQSTVFDPVRDRMILFGGGEGGGMGTTGPQYNDVWALSLVGTPAWTELHPTGAPPVGRQEAGCAYDPVRDRLVIFGGRPDYELTAYTDLNDVWALSLGGTPAWTQLQPSGTPPVPTYAPCGVYDPLRDRMLFGGGSAYSGPGTSGQMWSLDLASPQWTQLTTTGSPRGGGSATVYDAACDRLVTYFFSGSAAALALPTLEWARLAANAGPGFPYLYPWWDHVMTYDSSRGQVLVSGGFDANDYYPYFDNYYVEAYTLATGLWALPPDRLVPYGSRPTPRADHSAVVDDARARLILFGGLRDNGSQGVYVNETLAMTLTGTTAWSQLSPAGTAPTARAGQATVLDPAGDRMVIFGGTDGGALLDDVWALGLAGPQWSHLLPAGGPPPPRQKAGACYDPVGRRMIVFGGLNEAGVPFYLSGNEPSFNDIWTLDLAGSPAWTQLSPTGVPPPPTAEPIAVFDPDLNRVEILTDAGAWALYLESPPRWVALDIGGGFTGPLTRGAAIYDPVMHRVLAKPAYTQTLWELVFAGGATAIEASVIGVEATADRVGIAWHLSSGGSAAVYRRTADGPWARLGAAAADGTGRLAFEDANVAAGTRYGYRLGLLESGGEVFAGEVWVDVPALDLALRGVIPNPSPGSPSIAFSLPGPGPARLELLDLAGRRLAMREVGGLGAGAHVVRLATGGGLPPGIYLARLTRGPRSITTRVAIVR